MTHKPFSPPSFDQPRCQPSTYISSVNIVSALLDEQPSDAPKGPISKIDIGKEQRVVELPWMCERTRLTYVWDSGHGFPGSDVWLPWCLLCLVPDPLQVRRCEHSSNVRHASLLSVYPVGEFLFVSSKNDAWRLIRNLLMTPFR